MRILTIALAILCLFMRPGLAQQPYPTKQVRIIMPNPPGSTTDILARVIADELSRTWGQPVIVDNVTGAGGNIGSGVAARATPDGYTLLFVPPPPLVINQFMYRSVGFDADALAPVTLAASAPYVLDARPDFPASNLPDLIAYARKNPGKVTYASGGVGTTMQLYMLELENRAGISMVHVPYRGAAPALADLMAGHVDILFDVIATSLPVLEGKQVKGLAIGSMERSSAVPEIATMNESGLKGFEATTWFAMVAPPRTPPAIVDKINRDVVAALRKPSVAERLKALRMDLFGTSPAQTAGFLADQRALWGGVVKKAGITLE